MACCHVACGGWKGVGALVVAVVAVDAAAAAVAAAVAVAIMIATRLPGYRTDL